MVGPLAVAGEFLFWAAFYAVTVHVAASYVLADPPARRALLVGPVPAAVAVAGRLVGAPSVAFTFAVLAADFLAIATVYDLRARTAGLVTLAHLVVGIVLGFALQNLVIGL